MDDDDDLISKKAWSLPQPIVFVVPRLHFQLFDSLNQRHSPSIFAGDPCFDSFLLWNPKPDVSNPMITCSLHKLMEMVRKHITKTGLLVYSCSCCCLSFLKCFSLSSNASYVHYLIKFHKHNSPDVMVTLSFFEILFLHFVVCSHNFCKVHRTTFGTSKTDKDLIKNASF